MQKTWAHLSLADALRETAVSSESLLLDRARRGDAEAFASLAARCWSTLHRVARNMLPDEIAPARVVESAFVSLLRSRDALPAGVPFRISLYRVALGEAWRRLPQTSRGSPDAAADLMPRFDADGRLLSPGDEWSDESERSFAACDEDQIRAGLQLVEALDRAAFLLLVVERLSAEDAGVVLGIPPASIQKRAHRATLVLTGFLRRAAAPPPALRVV